MTRPGPTEWRVFGVLSPADRITEIFCALVMVLTVTLLTSQVDAGGPDGVRRLLRAALGGNIAWGVIDGVVYLMTQRSLRARQARLVAVVRDATDDVAIRGALDEVIDRELVVPMTADEAARVYGTLRTLAGRLDPVRPAFVRTDLIGALACFVLCVATALPAAVPFLMFDTPMVALRVSNGVSLVSLFVLGVVWAGVIGAHRLLTGFGLLLLGAALVGIQYALGG